MRLPTVGELVLLAPTKSRPNGLVLAVVKRRESKQGTRLTLVGATADFVVTKETKPVRRLPSGWTVLDSESAYDLIAGGVFA